MDVQTPVKIFIASSSELKSERDKCVDTVIGLNKAHTHLFVEPVGYEDLPGGSLPGHETIQDGINPLVQDCQLAIFIFYSKIGKYTRQEFDLCMRDKRKIFVYFKKGFTPDLDSIGEFHELLQFKKGLSDTVLYAEFESLAEFDNTVYQSLNKYLSKTFPGQHKKEITISSSRQLIPLAPRPYLAHPYSLPKNFTGRSEEMNKLTKWFQLDTEPVYVLEAIGGMGKSALTWTWLQSNFIGKQTEVVGIVWWSFYDQGFEDFIKHLFQYCIPENERKALGVVDEAKVVATCLTNYRFLLILDGFERVLRGYSQMMAMYVQEEGLSKDKLNEINKKWKENQRSSLNPKADRFIRWLCGSQSKILLTTRLFPTALEDRAGVIHTRLTGLSKTDTLEFFEKEKVNGRPDAVIRAASVYDYHPLMLKLLSSSISRSKTKNIDQAFNKNLIDEERPLEILNTSFALLDADEKEIASALSVFRSAFDIDAASALFPKMDSEKLWDIMTELRQLGFLLYQEQENLFDFHPIVRSFLYDQLTARENAHSLVIGYFENSYKKEKIVSLDQLQPLIELYHHLIRAGKIKEAMDSVLKNRLYVLLFHRFGQFDLLISLINELLEIPEGSSKEVLKPEEAGYLFYELSLSNSRIGALQNTNALLLQSMKCCFESNYLSGLGSALIYAPKTNQIYRNLQTVAIINSKKAATLFDETDNQRYGAYHEILGRVAGIRGIMNGLIPGNNDDIFAEDHFKKSSEFFAKMDGIWEGKMAIVTVEFNIVKSKLNEEEKKHSILQKAFKVLMEVFTTADLERIERYPVPRSFIEVYIYMGSILLEFKKYEIVIPGSKNEISFFDENFVNNIDTYSIDTTPILFFIERCLSEALVRSRQINLVEFESKILLSLAQFEWLKIITNEPDSKQFKEVLNHLKEAKEIAEKSGYILYLIDIHIFCAELLIEIKENNFMDQKEVLGLSAIQHLRKVRELAPDKSTIDDVFLPPDADEFYKGIPEYEMLKRGMTDQERIEGGYYIAWKLADNLEKRIAKIK